MRLNYDESRSPLLLEGIGLIYIKKNHTHMMQIKINEEKKSRKGTVRINTRL